MKIHVADATPIETFQEFPEMGRFALRDMGATIAAGVSIKKLPKRTRFKRIQMPQPCVKLTRQIQNNSISCILEAYWALVSKQV